MRDILLDPADEHLRTRLTRISTGYAAVRIENRRVLLHRYLLNAPEGMDVDHINKDILDNRRSNLRLCTRSQNSANTKARKGSSKYKGVHWDKQAGKWKAAITVNYKTKSLGVFLCEHQAALCYNKAALKYFGEFASLNAVTNTATEDCNVLHQK